MYNIIKDCSKCCTENKQDDETNSKRMDIYVGEEHVREGLSEEITCKLRPEDMKSWKGVLGRGNSKNKGPEVLLGPWGIQCFSLKKGLGGV